MEEEYSKFFKLILDFSKEDEDSNYELEKLSKKESVKNDLIILKKSISKSCKFWKNNVFLTLTKEDELWSHAVDTFKVFNLVDRFAIKVQKLKSNILNDHQDLYLMITKSKDFKNIIENSLNLVSLLRMVPLNNIRVSNCNMNRINGDRFSLNQSSWYFKHHKLPETFLETLAQNLGDIHEGRYEKIQTEILDTLEKDYFYDPENQYNDEVSDEESMIEILLELKKDKKLLNLIRTRYIKIQANKILDEIINYPF